MKFNKKKFKNCSLFLLLILLSACGSNQAAPATPTVSALEETEAVSLDSLASESQLVESKPTFTPIPLPTATATLPPPVTVSVNETEAETVEVVETVEAVVEESVESEPTVEPEVEPEPTVIERVPLTIAAPQAEGVLTTGRPFLFAGQVTPGQVVRVVLRSGSSELAAADFTADAAGAWSGNLDIPYSIEGTAVVTASHGDDKIEVDVTLGRDRENEAAIPGSIIDLDLPTTDAAVVSGYMMFLAGSILNPIDDTMTVGLLMDNCTNFVSRQQIPITTFEGSWSTWNAQIILPRGLQGDGCIVAYTGEYGTGDWREKKIPVVVVSENDSRASRVKIIDSFAGVLAQGDSIYVSGIATATDTVNFRLLRDGREEVVMVSVPVGDFGFWGVDFSIPTENAIGQMTLEVSAPGAEDRADSFEFEVR